MGDILAAVITLSFLLSFFSSFFRISVKTSSQQALLERIKQKPAYEMKTQQYNEKILALKQQIEDLIMERITDKSRSEFYNSMIEKRENEIAILQQKISDSQKYDKVCKQRQKLLKSTSDLLDEVLSQGEISDANLRMLVKSVTIHQNEDRSIDVHFEMNGDFMGSTTIMWEPGFEVVG